MLLRILRGAALALVGVVLLTVTRDSLTLDPAHRVAASHRYSLVRFELANIGDKWLYKLASIMGLTGDSSGDTMERLHRFFELGEEVRRLREEVRRAAAEADDATRGRLAALESELAALERERERWRPQAEETLEATISAVAVEQGLGMWGPVLWPPVDVKLGRPPKLLVTSPRHVIQRLYEVLLEPAVSVEEAEAMEEELLQESDLAALVVDIGGVATYPASIPDDQPLRWTLQIAAHEWLHHYLFFKPLGRNMFSDPDIQTLNETLADLAGKELGDEAYRRLGGVVEGPPPYAEPPPPEAPQDKAAFDFNREMRATRLRVDELLAQGRVEEAEAYMERRRRLFVENGYYIRKLNQAYFAFYGTYADNPSSVSPIGEQLREFRRLMPDVGSFIRTVAGFSSYQEFLEALERLRASASVYTEPIAVVP